MNSEKIAFIEMVIQEKVLKWGSFTLKSGRQSPYFFNAGLFYKGKALKRLGEFYAKKLCAEPGLKPTHLFGPAYKGIPLATATAIALAHQNIDVEVTFDRKEVKAHGEGGMLLGAPLEGREVVMIDDVITAGTAFRSSKALIEQAGGSIKAVIIALDRQERGLNEKSALEEIRAEGINVLSLITLNDLINYLTLTGEDTMLAAVKQYQAEYGA